MPFVQIHAPSLQKKKTVQEFVQKHIRESLLKVLQCPPRAITIVFVNSDMLDYDAIVHITIDMTPRTTEVKTELLKDIYRRINSTINSTCNKLEIKIDDRFSLEDWLIDGKTWREIVDGE